MHNKWVCTCIYIQFLTDKTAQRETWQHQKHSCRAGERLLATYWNNQCHWRILVAVRCSRQRPNQVYSNTSITNVKRIVDGNPDTSPPFWVAKMTAVNGAEVQGSSLWAVFLPAQEIILRFYLECTRSQLELMLTEANKLTCSPRWLSELANCFAVLTLHRPRLKMAA